MTTQQLCLESEGGEKPCGMWQLFSFQKSIREIGDGGERKLTWPFSQSSSSLFFFFFVWLPGDKQGFQMAIVMLLGMNKDFKCYYFKYSNRWFRHVFIWEKKLHSLLKPGNYWRSGQYIKLVLSLWISYAMAILFISIHYAFGSRYGVIANHINSGWQQGRENSFSRGQWFMVWILLDYIARKTRAVLLMPKVEHSFLTGTAR